MRRVSASNALEVSEGGSNGGDCRGTKTGESRRRTWSVKEKGSRCAKIYEHFVFFRCNW